MGWVLTGLQYSCQARQHIPLLLGLISGAFRASIMSLEVMKAVVGLVFLLGDISFVVACSILHFKRGDVEGGTVQGAFTLLLFFMAGLGTNLFHYFRYEGQRMEQRSLWAKAKCFLLLFVPCSSLLRCLLQSCLHSTKDRHRTVFESRSPPPRNKNTTIFKPAWIPQRPTVDSLRIPRRQKCGQHGATLLHRHRSTIDLPVNRYTGRCRNPRSVTRHSWMSTLRLMYCTGILTQAVLQGYVVVHLWWAQHVVFPDVTVTTVAAVYFSLRAIYGVWGYIWTGYYDKTHTSLLILNYTLILFAVTLNMGTVMDLDVGGMGNYLALNLYIFILFLMNLELFN